MRPMYRLKCMFRGDVYCTRESALIGMTSYCPPIYLIGDSTDGSYWVGDIYGKITSSDICFTILDPQCFAVR